jgi:hypothetical protein
VTHTLDFDGPSPDPSPYYAIPRSTADLLARSALVAASTRRGRTLVVLIKEIGTDALFALHRVTHGTDAYARVESSGRGGLGGRLRGPGRDPA